MGVEYDGGIPGSFPPAGRLPSPAVAGARDAPLSPRSRCGKLVDHCDAADSQNFRHFLLTSESEQKVPSMTKREK